MAKYTFKYEDEGDLVVTVERDDAKDPSLEPVIDAFIHFLLGVSFTSSSIAKSINSEMVA